MSGPGTTMPSWIRSWNGPTATRAPTIAVVRQELDAVGAALAALTDEQREAITLRFFAGLSAREAAEAMGKQEGTVRGLQFRAIAALRRQLGLELDGTDLLDRRLPRQANATTDG